MLGLPVCNLSELTGGALSAAIEPLIRSFDPPGDMPSGGAQSLAGQGAHVIYGCSAPWTIRQYWVLHLVLVPTSEANLNPLFGDTGVTVTL